MKKFSLKNKCILLCLLFLLLCHAVFADAGLKPTLGVTVIGLEGDSCLIDLYVESSYEHELNLENYAGDQIELFKKMHAYKMQGYSLYISDQMGPVLPILSDSEIKNGRATQSYSYHPPTQFKVIVIDEKSRIYVSDVIETNNYFSGVNYDINSGKIEERRSFIAYVLAFFCTCFTTIVLELVVLALFGLFNGDNSNIVVALNAQTQVVLFCLTIMTEAILGRSFSLPMFIVFELLIFGYEYRIYTQKLTCERQKSAIFSVVANLVSLLIGTQLSVYIIYKISLFL